MARNRKNQSAALRFGPALKAGVICATIVTACVGYVWQKQQINVLADQVRQRETRLVELREQNNRLNDQRATLVRPQYLESRIKELNLGLGLPKQAQIWRPVELAEPGGKPAAGPRQYAERSGAPLNAQ
jgi:hypothetical protein